MRKEIWVVRHGRTNFNKLGIWQGSGVDASLDEKGESQAESFYNAYKHIAFDLVITSELKRAIETMKPFIAAGIQHKIYPEINEISWGIYEGKPHTEKSLAEYTRVTGEWANENYEIGFTGGESAIDLQQRMESFCEQIKALDQDRLLICSHGRAIRAMLCVMKNEPLREMEKYKHANTGLFKGILENGSFSFEDYNNVDHLELSSYPSSSGIKK